MCEYCKYDIISDIPVQCLACLRPVARYGDVCSQCKIAYSKGWFVSLHQGAVRKLIGYHKFKRGRAANTVLADLLHQALPLLPPKLTITAVPTVHSHIRSRGYDHAALLAKGLASHRNIPYKAALKRARNTTQRGAGRAARIKQAEQAFKCNKRLSGPYLLIDDVCTTGATVHFAAKALLAAGASQVWVAVISREPLN